MTIIITLWYCGILFVNAHVNWLMLYRLSSLQTEEALKKAREKLEFLRDVMMIPRNLAGEIRQSLMLLLSSFLRTEFCMEFSNVHYYVYTVSFSSLSRLYCGGY